MHNTAFLLMVHIVPLALRASPARGVLTRLPISMPGTAGGNPRAAGRAAEVSWPSWKGQVLLVVSKDNPRGLSAALKKMPAVPLPSPLQCQQILPLCPCAPSLARGCSGHRSCATQVPGHHTLYSLANMRLTGWRDQRAARTHRKTRLGTHTLSRRRERLRETLGARGSKPLVGNWAWG